MKDMPAKRRFKFNENRNGDVEILAWVYECRRVTIDQLVALTGRSEKTLYRRLAKLSAEKYLHRKREFPVEKYVYTIGRGATDALIDYEVALDKAEIDKRIRLRENTNLFRKHEFMLTDIHIALELASRTSPIKLSYWTEGKELHDSVMVYENGELKKLPVRPDAFFVLSDTRLPEEKNRRAFFLEADRSTTTSKRFQRKIKGYAAYFEQGLNIKKYKFRTGRVVTITGTEGRAAFLSEASREVLDKDVARFYYFASMKYFDAANPNYVFDDILMSARDFDTDIRYALFPPLAKQGTNG